MTSHRFVAEPLPEDEPAQPDLDCAPDCPACKTMYGEPAQKREIRPLVAEAPSLEEIAREWLGEGWTKAEALLAEQGKD